MVYIAAAVFLWITVVASAFAYLRRRGQQRCGNIACSRQSRDLERVTVPSKVDGLTFDVRLCPDCFALYSRWARG